jgi:hypothetical protein
MCYSWHALEIRSHLKKYRKARMSYTFESVLLLFVTGAIAVIVVALVKSDLDRGRKSHKSDDPPAGSTQTR